MTFDLDLENVVQYPPNHMNYASAKFEAATSISLREYAFTKKYIMTLKLDIVVKITQNLDQYPLHRATYSHVKFEAATSNGLGGDPLTRNSRDVCTHVRTY